MNWTDRITVDPGVLTGKPVIRGTRLAVDFIVGLLAQDWSEADIIRNYPGIIHADITACLKTVRSTAKAVQGQPYPGEG